MVLVDEKSLMPPHTQLASQPRPREIRALPSPPQPPPPPYTPAEGWNALPPPPFPSRRPIQTASLNHLPPHILLHIVYLTFPQSASIDFGKIQRQRKTLYWLETELRLVNKSFYIACMHVLRSTYISAYTPNVRRPYSSDPFPATSNLTHIQRETAVLDQFISIKVREDVWADDTEFHLEGEERFRDLFDVSQPRARLEDLVRFYAERKGLVCVSLPSVKRNNQVRPVEFWRLSVAFGSRVVGLVYQPDAGPKKKWFEVVRESRDELLEVTAKRIVREMEKRLTG